METNKPNEKCKRICGNVFLYTREQRLVMTVWYHERIFTGLSYDQLSQNFLERFKTASPSYKSVNRWEKQLFKHGSVPISTRFRLNNKATIARLVHVPYVKENLIRFPDLTLRARARFLGMTEAKLKTILKEDLKYDFGKLKKSNTEKTNSESNTI